MGDIQEEAVDSEHALEVNNTLKNIYYNLKNPAAYSTVEKLYEATEGKISREKITQWLGSQLAYTLHKPRRINFKRNHYNADNINDDWQADLMDLSSLSPENDGFKYVLLVIDAFSRYVRLRPLKTKSANEVLKAFKSIVEESEKPPGYLVTDRGELKTFLLFTIVDLTEFSLQEKSFSTALSRNI